jgi:peptidoglycan hydrolase CwlO-like protein
VSDNTRIHNHQTPLIDPISRRDALKILAAVSGAALLAGPRAALADTASDLAAAQQQYDQVEQQLSQIGQQYEQLSKEQSDTMGKIEQVQAQIDAKQAEIDKKQAELDEKQQLLAKRISSYYKSGNQGAIELLLSSASFEDFLSNVYYMGKINSSDQQMIDDVKSAKDELDREKADLETQRESLQQLNDQQTAQLDDMRAKQAETQQLLSSVSQSVKDLMAQRDAEILAAAQAAEAARKATASSYSSGNVSLPSAGGGQEYQGASAAQKAIVNACHSVPSPGAGYCAAWVSDVYSAAGQGFYGGDACDMYASYCTSSNKADLKVGMAVAVSSHTHTSAGRIYGHIGIYVGDGTMMDNVGYIRTINVDEWIGYYGTTVTPRWGWLGGKSLA